jgi:hypothetical protein
MAEVYHSVPLDEEQQILDGGKWEGMSILSTNQRYESTIFLLARRWAWSVHAVLLATSTLLFLLSLRDKGNKSNLPYVVYCTGAHPSTLFDQTS